MNGNVIKQTSDDDSTYNLRSRAKPHQNGMANGIVTDLRANGVHKQNRTATNGHVIQAEKKTTEKSHEEHKQEQKNNNIHVSSMGEWGGVIRLKCRECKGTCMCVVLVEILLICLKYFAILRCSEL